MPAPGMRVPFVDLRLHVRPLRRELDEAMGRVLDSGWFVLGAENEALERELAAALGTRDAVTVANGTEAIQLALEAHGVGPGDEVLTTPLTAAFTSLAIVRCGAVPVFVDVDPATLTLDPSLLGAALTSRTRAIMPVHLYGQPADMDPILAFAREHGLVVVEDACQAHGAADRGRPVGFSGCGALSFYPTKNLGALGDGGAILVNDSQVAERLRRLRNGGQTRRYQHDLPGMNSRLDELQAAVLRAKLPHLRAWTARRREIADIYRRELQGLGLTLPFERPEADSVYHLFVVRSRERERLTRALEERGVGTLVHYPVPLHRMAAFSATGRAPAALPVAENAAREVLSLPLYPEMRADDVTHVVEAVRASLRSFV